MLRNVQRARSLARLVDVTREGRRKLEPVRFETFAAEWIDKRDAEDELKRSTLEGYRSIIENHLTPTLGRFHMGAIDAPQLERYKVTKRQTLGPRTVNRHLNLLSLLFNAATKAGLARTNPVASVDRPKDPDNNWRILSPVEIGRVERAFVELVDEARDDDERVWCEQARVVFLTVMLAGLRRGEILGLRWRDVALTDPDGSLLTVRETWVRGAPDTPKSKRGRRTFDMGKRLAEELAGHLGRTAYSGDDERVFCNPLTGRTLDPKRYAATLRAALAKAGITDRVRPFHDGRHTSITNSAAGGMEPMKMMKRAGHADFATTMIYVELAGETFPEAAELLEERLFGQKSGQT